MSQDKTAKKLLSYSIRGAEEALSPEDREAFEGLLDHVLAQEAAVEEEIVYEVLEGIEGQAVGDYFLSELEIQSELVFLGKKKDQAALLMCMPVIFMAGDQPQRLALSTDEMEELCHVLTETDVVGSQAKLGLLPRLFTPQELVSQPYGNLRKLAAAIGQQVLDGDPVRLESGIIAEGATPSDKFAWGDNPYVELRYLVGVVVTHESALDDVFPAVGPESTDAELFRLQADVQADEREEAGEGEEGVDEGFDETVDDFSENSTASSRASDEELDAMPAPFEGQAAPGEGPNGEFWEDVFLEVVDEVFFPFFGAQATLLPDDFHENLRRGLSLWRECGMKHQVNEGFHPEEPVLLYAKPYVDEATGRMGWDVVMAGEDGSVRDHGPWEVLQHEAPGDTQENLEFLCEAMGWTLAELTPLASEH
jgi:hypothetical protein